MTRVKGHNKKVNIIVEPTNNRPNSSVVAVPSHTTLKPGFSKVNMNIKNLTSRKIMVKPKSIIARANVIPPILAQENSKKLESPNLNSKRETEAKLTKDQLEKVFKEIDLSGINDWSEEDQIDVKKLINDFGFLFTINDLDLGKTNTVKHTIKLTDYTPFKERYHRIPPHQFGEVRKHLEEMLEIGAIKCSNSPWASTVVLVQKKDGSLRFCIDLRKLNAHKFKDA